MATKYVNDENLQSSLEAVRDRLLIKDKTEAQAITASASYPNCVYYTSDTHNLVQGGHVISAGIGYGTVDSTSTSTAFTATVPGITELKDGTAVMLRNNKVTSAANFTININGLGAKPAYSNMATGATPTRETTIFNANYTMLFVYSSTIVSGGGWVCYRGYNSDNNTIGYQLRTNSTVYKASDTSRYYKIFFTSADGNHLVPASVNSTNNATSARPVNQRPIDPFGRIAYTSASTNYPAEGNIAATTLWEQYNITLGYSFNRTGAALTLTTSHPVYVKCAPQTDGSAIMDADTPIVQALPSTEDGKIYIFLGIATSATAMELYVNHPVYYYKNGAIRLWTNDVSKYYSENDINEHVDSASINVTSAQNDAQIGIKTETSGDNMISQIDITSNGSTAGIFIESDYSNNGGVSLVAYNTAENTENSIFVGNDIEFQVTGGKVKYNDNEVGLAPLVIEVNDTDEEVPSGTYASITAAITAGRDVVVKVIPEEQEEALYLPLFRDASQNDDEYYFCGINLSDTYQFFVDSSDICGFTSSELSRKNHEHGNIGSTGVLQFNDITIANGDKLVVTDASDSNKIARTSLTFDGSTTSQALTKKGTFETFVNDVSGKQDNITWANAQGTAIITSGAGVTIKPGNNVSFEKEQTSGNFLKINAVDTTYDIADTENPGLVLVDQVISTTAGYSGKIAILSGSLGEGKIYVKDATATTGGVLTDDMAVKLNGIDNMSQSEADTGTAATGRLVSASVLATATKKRIGNAAGDWLTGNTTSGTLNFTPNTLYFNTGGSWIEGDEDITLSGQSWTGQGEEDGVIGLGGASWNVYVPLAKYATGNDAVDQPGVIALGYTQSGNNFPLQVDSSGRAFTNVLQAANNQPGVMKLYTAVDQNSATATDGTLTVNAIESRYIPYTNIDKSLKWESSHLGVRLKDTSLALSTTTGSEGLSVNLAANSGLEVSNGLKMSNGIAGFWLTLADGVLDFTPDDMSMGYDTGSWSPGDSYMTLYNEVGDAPANWNVMIPLANYDGNDDDPGVVALGHTQTGIDYPLKLDAQGRAYTDVPVEDIISGRVVIKDKTEAQALAQSPSNPNYVYYTSDTHNIVVNGSIFGRSSQVASSAFAFASDTSAISTWDTAKIYLVPTATSGVLSVYIYENGGWEIPGTLSLTPVTDAEDITYDLTNTPDLGDGDVQSAIEAVDWKHTLVAGKSIKIYQPLPDEYTRVEWLQGSYTAYINTGIAGGKDTLEIECEYSYSSHLSYASIYGNYVDENTNCWRLILRNTDDNGCLVNYNTKASGGNTYIADINTKNEFHTVILNNERTIFDGIIYNISTNIKGTANNSNLALFAYKVGATGTSNIGLKVKRFIIRDEGVEVLNLIPCRRNSDNALGMYDIVNGSFLTKEGSGSFSAGADVPPNEIMGVYDDTLTNLGTDTVQGAIENLDKKVEQLNLDTTGEHTDGSTEDYWEDQMYEKNGVYEVSPNNRRIGANHAGTTDSNGVNRKVYVFPASEGDVFKVTGANGSGPAFGFWKGAIAYSSIIAANYLIDWSGTTGTFVAPANATLFAFVTIDTNIHSGGARVWKKTKKEQQSIVDKAGRLITEWSNNTVISGAAVGTYRFDITTPYMQRNTALAPRTACVKVNEGDKLLIDVRSYYGSQCLRFEDENGQCVSAPDSYKAELKGVYTAPCDGRCYIRDVYFRDCFIYNKAYGYLAYEAFNKLDKTTDNYYPNLLGGETLSSALPFHISKNVTTAAGQYFHTPRNFYSPATNFVLTAAYVRKTASHTATATWYVNIESNPTSISESGAKTLTEEGVWLWRIWFCPNAINSTFTIRMNSGAGMIDCYADALYAYVCDDYDTTLALMNHLTEYDGRGIQLTKIQNKELAMASIVGIGYNLLDYLPENRIKPERFQVASKFFRDNNYKLSGTGQSKLAGQLLWYYPDFDLSGITTTMNSFFNGCTSIQVIKNLDLGGNTLNFNTTFYNCQRLEYVGDINAVINGAQSMFANCYSLKYVGRLTAISLGSNYMFQSCHNLERVEEIDMSNMANIPLTDASYNMFGVNYNNVSLRYFFLRNFGKYASCVGTYRFLRIPNWGVPKQAAIDAGTYDESTWTDPYPTCTLQFSATTKGLLTSTMIGDKTLAEAITEKGYTIT